MSDSHAIGADDDATIFREMVDGMHDFAIYRLTPDGHVATWSDGAEKVLRYAEKDVIGQPLATFFVPEDRAAGKPEALLRTAAAEGRAEDEGWRIQGDGTHIWANGVVAALRSDDGDLTGFVKVTRDVTARHRAEEALRLRERQLADTQRLAGLGSWEWDVRADRVSWTDELYTLYGLDSDTFAATFAGYLERVHLDDRERVRGIIEGAFARGGEFDFEERIVRPDGDVRTLRSRGRAIQDEAGRTIRLTGACLDITEIKKAEAREAELAREQAAREAAESTATGLGFLLRASEVLASSLDYEAILRSIADMAVSGFADWCAVDLLEGETLKRVAVAHPDPAKVALVKEFAERYPPERDAPTGAWHVIDTGEAEYFPDIPDEMLAALVEDPAQLEMIRSLGLRSAISVPLTGRSGVIGVLTVVQAESERRLTETDLWITEQLGRHAALAIESAALHRELEEQHALLADAAMELEQQTEELQIQAVHMEDVMAELEAANEELQTRTSEAEEANRAKAEFLATMSHELRTPLNAIFGYADLLDLGLHGPVTPAQRHALDRIKRNQRSLLALINDVLNFAKLEAGKLELAITEIPVREVITDLEAVVAPQLQSKGLRYEFSAGAEDVEVRCERERLEQILLNLLTNAIKFTDAGGLITLSTEFDADTIRFDVSDTGCGIPPARLKAIFDPFVQLDRTTTEGDDRGVGLGLAISRNLATAMGGDLQVRSEVGAGSVFSLTLPRAR